MAEFTPEQLDSLEDALASVSGLEPGTVDGIELDPTVAARLGEYEVLLAASRDAFPSVDVPSGLLDGVLAEAKASVAQHVEAAAGSGGIWARLRPFLLPTLALAGSTAAVLLFIRPGEDDVMGVAENSRHTTTGDPPAAAAAKLDDIAPRDEAKDTTNDPNDLGEPSDDDAGARGSPGEEVLPGEAAAPGTEDAARPKKKARAGSMPVVDAPQPTSESPAVTKDEGWAELERAHSQRRKGNCDGASTIYRAVAASGLGEAGRAQALGGLGLCLESSGDSADSVAAQSKFTEARRLTPEIDSWIAKQRGAGSTAGNSGKGASTPAKAKKSAAKKASADAMADVDG